MSTVTPETRARLDSIRARVHDARDRVNTAEKGARQLAQAGGVDRDEMAVAAGKVAGARAELDHAQQLERDLLSQMADALGGPSGGGSSVLEDPQLIRQIQGWAHSEAKIGNVDLGRVVSREGVISRLRSGDWRGNSGMLAVDSVDGTIDLGTAGAGRTGAWQGIRPQIRRQLSVLDLIPTATMDNNGFYYTQESGSLDFAEEIADLTAKPVADVSFDDAQVTAQTIAAWIKASRPQMDDEPQLQATLTGRTTYGVMRRLENEVLAGNGEGSNILGILNQTGIVPVAYNADEALTDLTLDGITAVWLNEVQPTAVIMHPTDVAAMLKAKATGSGERLDSSGAFAPTSGTIWDLPRVVSTAITQGTALVGDFAGGCTLFVREGVNVRISDSDQDDFTKNRMTILAEGRFGLAVWSPPSFAVVSLKAPESVARSARRSKPVDEGDL